MIDVLRDNRKIIVNTDIDGILCALVLTNYVGCEVVGYSNSSETVWIDESKVNSIYDAVYIDMFVPREDVITIDQHIIAVNERHWNILQDNPKKINPNIDNPRFFQPNSSYYLKYPFGTIHYICAYLNKEGINVEFNIDDTQDNLRLGDLILRADDAMTTTLKSNYIKNAKEWWSWLTDFSNNGRTIKQFTDFLDSTPSDKALNIKDKIKFLLQGGRFSCDSPDGGYKSIIDERGNLLPKVRLYIEYIAARTGLDVFNLSLQLTPYKGKARRLYMNSMYERELIDDNTIDGQEVFSYGFVRSANRPANFSYTIM